VLGHLVIRKNKAKTNPIKAKTNPIQTQLLQRVKMMQSVNIQRITKKMRLWAMKKQTQFKANFKSQNES